MKIEHVHQDTCSETLYMIYSVSLSHDVYRNPVLNDVICFLFSYTLIEVNWPIILPSVQSRFKAMVWSGQYL